MKRLIGIPLELQYARLGGTTAGDATYQRFKAAYARYRDAHAAAATRVMPDAPDTLAELKRTGVLLGVVSTGAGARIRQILSAVSLTEHFQSISGGGRTKQKEYTLRCIVCTPVTATRYIGDRPDDAEAAARAHVDFIAVLTGAGLSKC
jgi:phosphoglycolate phosphatase-like HAD superfamily hydrolase